MKICERRCPHCGYGGSKGAPTAAAVLLGLALSACTSSEPAPTPASAAEPAPARRQAVELDQGEDSGYGVPETDDDPPELETSPGDAKQPRVRSRRSR